MSLLYLVGISAAQPGFTCVNEELAFDERAKGSEKGTDGCRLYGVEVRRIKS